MKVALITTTINVPKVLSHYAALGNVVDFYIAGDEKTPREAYEYVGELAASRFARGEMRMYDVEG